MKWPNAAMLFLKYEARTCTDKATRSWDAGEAVKGRQNLSSGREVGVFTTVFVIQSIVDRQKTVEERWQSFSFQLQLHCGWGSASLRCIDV